MSAHLRLDKHFYDALLAAGCITELELKILKDLFFSREEKEDEIELVKVTLTDLGLKHGATLRNIYVRAIEIGLGVCPPETAARICLEYDSNEIQYLHVISHPILSPKAKVPPAIFGVSYHINRNRPKHFEVYTAVPHHFFENDGSWIFKWRKSPLGL